MIAFWLALGILVVAFVVGVAFAVVRALETKRAVKSLQTALEAELQSINRAGERSAEGFEAAAKAFVRIQESVLRLNTARARLRLINNVLAEIEEFATRARAFVPSK